MKVLCLWKPRDQIYDVELMKGRAMTRGEAADLSSYWTPAAPWITGLSFAFQMYMSRSEILGSVQKKQGFS